MKGVKYLCTALLTLCITFLLSLKLSSNASALYTQDYGVRTLSWSNDECGNPYYSEGHLYNQYFSGCGVTTVVPISSSVTATGDTVVYSGKLNIVKEIDSQGGNRWRPYPNFAIRSVYFAGIPLILQQPPVINYWITNWSDNVNGVQMNYSTLTIQWSFIATGNISNNTGVIRISIYNDQSNEAFDLNGFTNQLNYYYFEPTSDDVQVVFTDNGSSYYNQMINQNQTIINQNQEALNRDNQDREELQNTSDSASDSAEQLGNQVVSSSTNFITLIGNFFNVILHPPASNCVIDGDMGHMDLGNIDLCQLTPPPAISVIGGLLILGMLIPLVLAVIWRFIKLLRFVVGGM